MTSIELNLETLGKINNGEARDKIEYELNRAALDIDAWGEDGKTRKVIIELRFTKRDDGLVETKVLAQAKLPPHEAASVVLKPQRKGAKVALLFEDWEGESESKQAG